MTTLHLAVSAGDPQGIGPFVSVLAAAETLQRHAHVSITLCGSQTQIEQIIQDHAVKLDPVRFTIHDIPHDKTGTSPSPEGGRHAMAALNAALSLIDKGASALVTAPLSKEAVAMEIPNFTGHTEYLAHHAKSKALMLLANDKLRVALATTHIPVSEVGRTLNAEVMVSQLQLLGRELILKFGVARPKIAILALNPHAGEGGLIGTEEINSIDPMIKSLGGEEAGFYGPFSADTFFMPGRFDQFDAVFAMYHDQGLIPVKMLGPNSTVNITLGLPFVRTSPDHGTAFDLKNPYLADWQSMYHAMTEACRQVTHLRDAHSG